MKLHFLLCKQHVQSQAVLPSKAHYGEGHPASDYRGIPATEGYRASHILKI